MNKLKACLLVCYRWTLGHPFFWAILLALAAWIPAASTFRFYWWVSAIPLLCLLCMIWELRRRLKYWEP